MKKNAPSDVTQLLHDWCRGERDALDKLIPLVYDELHRIAHRYMAREHPGRTLQTTALVNEAYLRLIDARNVKWEGRTQFFGIAANLMRRILVDFARNRGSKKRGGEVQKLVLEEAAIALPDRHLDLVALDDALQVLASIDSRAAQVVELRFFGGLSVEETAQALNLSPITVMRDWRAAKVWLFRELEQSSGSAARTP
jgi:RNA polymerase sigma-70 factor (ECF subfamily)